MKDLGRLKLKLSFWKWRLMKLGGRDTEVHVLDIVIHMIERMERQND